MRTCEHCDQALRAIARADARYCSTRCRVAAHRAGRVPAEMQQADRWVRWDRSKRPIQSDTGLPASSTDPTTWSTYETAVGSNRGSGIGFVLNGDGIVCLDLDHCLVDGELVAWAADLLARCPRTFIEVSPSGDGLHVWGRGQVGRGRVHRRGAGQVEVYGTGRYITVTGVPWRGSVRELADLSSVIATL